MTELLSVEIMKAHVAAIKTCIASKLTHPALVLIYTGIDFVASINRPAFKTDVDRQDFISWVDNFMDCSRLGVNGLDLYAARCGVVHTYSPDSKLSRDGKAKRIMYAWGNKKPDDQNALLKKLGYSEVFVKLETLYDVFVQGLVSFGDYLEKNPEMHELVRTRDRKLIGNFAEFLGIKDIE